METRFLMSEEVCEQLRISRSTLQRWRRDGTGPRCIKVGWRWLYPAEDFERWLDQQQERQGSSVD